MPTYARLDGNVVAEIFTPPVGVTIAQCFHGSLQWVQCDSTPGVSSGWIATSLGSGVWSFAPPPAPPGPTPAQQALAQVNTGLAVTSTGTPTLDGTYAIDGVAQGRIAAVSTYILVNGRFPGGVTSYPWIDMASQAHVFPTTTSFQSFATAIADYVADLDMIIATNSGTLPTSTRTIA